MADKQELIDTIHEMKEERKLYKALPFGSAEWTAALPFMAALESRLAEQEKALVQLQGECLASRSPASSLVAPCMPANPRRAALTNSWELPKG